MPYYWLGPPDIICCTTGWAHDLQSATYWLGLPYLRCCITLWSNYHLSWTLYHEILAFLSSNNYPHIILLVQSTIHIDSYSSQSLFSIKQHNSRDYIDHLNGEGMSQSVHSNVAPITFSLMTFSQMSHY